MYATKPVSPARISPKPLSGQPAAQRLRVARTMAVVAMAAAMLALTGLPKTALAGPVTFAITPFVDDNNISALEGTVTVSDADGNQRIDATEVLAWSLRSTGALVLSVTSGVGASLSCPLRGCFQLAGDRLTFDFSSSSDQSALRFVSDDLSTVQWVPDNGLFGDAIAGDRIALVRWFLPNGAGAAADTFSLSSGSTVTVGVVQTVTEPTTLWLMGGGLMAALAQRNRGRRVVARS